jgi:chromosome segregation ATPase
VPSAEVDASAEGDLDRLQRAVEHLLERHRALRAECARLERLLVERDAKLRELNQRRQDALKRIDELIAQIDRLDVGREERG